MRTIRFKDLTPEQQKKLQIILNRNRTKAARKPKTFFTKQFFESNFMNFLKYN